MLDTVVPPGAGVQAEARRDFLVLTAGTMLVAMPVAAPWDLGVLVWRPVFGRGSWLALATGGGVGPIPCRTVFFNQ